jgi:hypothetical protein
MGNYDHLREIAVLPCLPAGLSVEDSYLERTAPSFGIEFVRPNEAMARTLSFLNISKRQYLDLVIARRGIDLLSAEPQGSETGAWRYRPEYAADWRVMRVAHDPALPALLTDDELVEIMENAGYGGQLAIAGYVDVDLALPRAMRAARLTGRFQIGIIDYIWGSGHTIGFDGSLTVDLSDGQIGDAPGYAFDGVCDFVVSHFRFDKIEPATLPPGCRFVAERRPPLARAA